MRLSPGRLLALLSVAALLAGIALLNACTAPAVMESVLGPPVKPTPVIHQARRPPYKPYQEPTMLYNMEPPKQINWADRLAKLPKDDAGSIDWDKALNEGLIHPKPGLDKDAVDQEPMDMNVELTPKDQPEMKAIFPHKAHTQWLVCDNCHTEIFQMEAGADPITMDKIYAGEYCGRCHGPVAFDVSSACGRCHPAMGG
jgi:c(7)-type cytochrome triheme protein